MTISHPKLTPERAAGIVSRWRNGWSVARIASSLKGIPRTVVRAVCAETGYRIEDLNPRPRGPSRKWTPQEIVTLKNMLANDVSYTEIAKRLRRSIDAVREKAEDLRAHEQCSRRTSTQSLPRARPRKCLRCGQLFDSEGPHNRICDDCKRHDVYGGFAIYAIGVGRQ